MMRNKLRDSIVALLPPELAEELRDNLDAVLNSNLAKMNLVTREQFEIQGKVLHRTRARMMELEKQVAELEKRMTAGGNARKKSSTARAKGRKN